VVKREGGEVVVGGEDAFMFPHSRRPGEERSLRRKKRRGLEDGESRRGGWIGLSVCLSVSHGREVPRIATTDEEERSTRYVHMEGVIIVVANPKGPLRRRRLGVFFCLELG